MRESILALFQATDHDDRALIDGLERLAEEHGDMVYREALRHLVGKSFSVEIAARYWREMIAHRAHVLVRERVENGLRPALLDYLHHVVQEISDPRIVEAHDLETMRKASMNDGLTGLFNQTYFKSYLEKLVGQRPLPGEMTTAVVLFDLDHFKQYNDRCGHLAGDEALKKVAELILAGIRQGDVAARYGGEEFGLVLQSTNPNLAIEGALLTMYDSRLNLSKQVAEDVQNTFSEKVFKTIIPRSVKLSEAPSFGKPVILYDVVSIGAVRYMELAREILEK
jgi:diguanylate cyclase (GGDEF)-like protein